MSEDSNAHRVSGMENAAHVEDAHNVPLAHIVQTTQPPVLIEFLRHVLPDDGEGWYCWWHKKNGYPQQGFVKTIPELALKLQQVCAEGYDAYFALSTFKDPNHPKPRSQNNVHKTKSHWLDIDCGTEGHALPSKYINYDQALKALDDFCDALQLPLPTVVNSGGGLHCYWIHKEPLDRKDWERIANKLDAWTKKMGLDVDPSRTADISSIMRAPETYNYKLPNRPRPVVSDELMTDIFIDVPEIADTQHTASSEEKAPETKADRRYDPAFANIAADFCAQLNHFRETKGNVPEPVWYACLGVIAYCEDSEEVAQPWSSGYPKYSQIETAEKLAQARDAVSGPITCKHFRKINPRACLNCPFNVNSPIDLGRCRQTTIEILNRRYAWIVKVNKIWRFDHQDFIDVKDFKNELANLFIITKMEKIPAATYWLRSNQRREYGNVVYEPGKPHITANNEINLWRGWGCEPIAGDISQFLALLLHLVENDQEKVTFLMKWLAYPIQHPGEKLMVVVVIWSRVHGVGKSLFAEMIAGLYGANAVTIGTDELEDNFNGWLRGRQFIIGEEIAGADKRKFSDKLKQLVTGLKVIINEKFQPRIELRNTVNFMFLSNLAVPVYVEEADRRYYVIHANEQKQSEEFYASIWNWYQNGGKSAVFDYLKYRVDIAGFNPHAPAPRNDDKDSVIDLGRSSVERNLRELREGGDEGRPLRSGEELASLMNTNTTVIARALTQLGAPPARRVYVNNARTKSYYVVSDYKKWAAATNEQWAEQIQRQTYPHHIRAVPGR